MYKTVLLTAVAIVALTAGSAAAPQPFAPISGKAGPFQAQAASRILYSQNSKDEGPYGLSENFTSGSSTAYNCQAADDFVIPSKQTWLIKEIDATGTYVSESGPATSENVIFYKDAKGMPGKPVRKGTFTNLKGTDNHGNFAITLPGKALKLDAGTYWVSVIANMDYPAQGLWYWNVTKVQHNNQAMWQNPPGGFYVCPTWGTIEDCIGYGPDLMFDLRGSPKAR